MAPADVKVVATNRRARRDYDVLDTVECGIVLRGSEVKSLREARVQLSDANARIIGGEMWLVGLHIQPYSHAAGYGTPTADRDRKLLLHREEIGRLRARVDQDRLALVPLRLYFRDGRAKVEVALARGRRKYDKRDAIAKRDADLEARRALAQSARGAGRGDG
jgi:SsrA-binding protein